MLHKNFEFPSRETLFAINYSVSWQLLLLVSKNKGQKWLWHDNLNTHQVSIWPLWLNGETLSHEVIDSSDQSFKWAVWNPKLVIFPKWDTKVLTSSWAKGKVPGFFLIVDVPSCQGCLPAKSTSGWDSRWRPLLWSKLGNWRNSKDFVKLIKNKLGALQLPICCLCDQVAASYSQCYCSLKKIFPDIVGRLLASPLW